MGSRDNAIVPYGSRSRSPSNRRKRRSPSTHRKRSRSRSKPAFRFQSEKSRAFYEKFEQKKLAREQAAARVEAGQKAVDAAQKNLQEAITAEAELIKELQNMSQDKGKIDLEDRIQSLVDERQAARQARDYSKSDTLRQELRTMGVEVNDKEFIWTGPQGLTGKNYYGGAPPPKRKGNDDDRRGRDRGRRSPSYDRGRRSPSSNSSGGRRGRNGNRGGRQKRRQRYDDSMSGSDGY